MSVFCIQYQFFPLRGGYTFQPTQAKFSINLGVGNYYFFFFLLPTPPFSPCEGRQPILFLLLCSLVVLAWASICLGVLNLFRQVSTRTCRNQLPILRCTNVHPRRHTCSLIVSQSIQLN